MRSRFADTFARLAAYRRSLPADRQLMASRILAQARRGLPASHNGQITLEESQRFLTWCVYLLRAATILVVLLVTLLQPVRGRFGNILEINILLFAGYNVLIEIVRRPFPLLRPLFWICILDIPVALLVYALGAAPGDMLFVFVFLDVICAAISMPLRGSLLFTALMMIAISVIDPTLPLWSDDAGDVRRLTGRLVILALTALGITILTQRLHLEQESALAHRTESERLAELDRMRANFIAGISHDLRTPLTGIRAGVGMLEASLHDRLRPDEQELIGSTQRNGQRLGWLVEDLLTFNQLEAHVLQLVRVPLDLRSIVFDILPMLHPLIEEKGQTIEVDLPDPLPVAGDARRLEHVLTNLLSNAHQHTPRGSRITISGHATASWTQLSVSDTGPGIPPTEHAAIFQRFYQLTGSRGSSGLGLAIVKGIVDLHGGRVWVESEQGNGATFHVVLPQGAEEDL